MDDAKKHSVLVVVPAYNAADYLPELIERTLKYVCPSNFLIVNDGSTDSTLELLKKHRVNYISFPVNRGKGAALKAGFNHAVKNGYRSVLTLDADLQHLPEEIPAFFAMDDGEHLIIGTRHINLKIMPAARWFTNNLSSIVISIFSGSRMRDSQSGFRLIPVSLIRKMPLQMVRYDFESEMLFKAGAIGCPVAEISISTVYEESPSYINPFKDSTRFIRQIWKRIWA